MWMRRHVRTWRCRTIAHDKTMSDAIFVSIGRMQAHGDCREAGTTSRRAACREIYSSIHLISHDSSTASLATRLGHIREQAFGMQINTAPDECVELHYYRAPSSTRRSRLRALAISDGATSEDSSRRREPVSSRLRARRVSSQRVCRPGVDVSFSRLDTGPVVRDSEGHPADHPMTCPS